MYLLNLYISITFLCVILFIVYLYFHIRNTKIVIGKYNTNSMYDCENFEDQVNYETQERAGPMSEKDEDYKQILETEFPKIPTYFVPFKRFFIELFEDVNYNKSLVSLKDTTEQLVSVRLTKPIKSIRIQSVPNAHWIYLQFFSVGIYLENDVSRSKGVIFHVPNNNESVEYEIMDTTNKTEGLEWMTNDEPKIVYFTTNVYNPIVDLVL